MNSFTELLENDPTLVKERRELAKKLHKERTDRVKQLETAKQGKLYPHLSLGPVIQNTTQLQEKIKRESAERETEIKKRYSDFKFKRAKELEPKDPKGYEKWLKHEKLKAGIAQNLKEVSQNTKNRDRDRSQQRDR